MITKPTKYPAEWVLKELKKWLKQAKEDENIVFIKQFCEKTRYSYNEIRDAKDYILSKKHKLSPQISAAWEQIKLIIEGRVYRGALAGKFNSNIAQLGLKYNHNWIDKQVIDQKTEITSKPTEELEEELAEDLANIS